MNMPEQEARRPGRPKREDVTQTERRRRSGGNTSKMDIPLEVREAHPDMDFRWGRDDEGRIQQLTQNDDWEKVPGQSPMHAGVTSAGQPMKQFMLMKPKRFMADDQAEKMARIDQIVNAQLARPDAAKAAEQGADLYSVPGNKL